MKSSKRSSNSKPTDQEAQRLCDAIRSLGDYEHVRVRAERGHLNIYPDEYEPIARFSPLGGGEYSLSFRKHTGRWEPMPFAGDISHLAQDLVTTLAPFYNVGIFPTGKAGQGTSDTAVYSAADSPNF